MRKLLAGASVLALVAFAGPALADDIEPLVVDVTNSGIDLDDSDFNEDAISLNVNRQSIDNTVDTDDGANLVEDEGLYNADLFFGDKTFEEQKVNNNNINSGNNAGQQNGIAVAVDINDKDGAVSLNVLDQNGHNRVGNDPNFGSDLDDLVDGSEYDGEMHFGEKTFEKQKVNNNNLNTGINAGQQGGIAVAVSGNPFGFPVGDNNDSETAHVEDLDVFTTDNGIHLELEDVDSDAFAGNVSRQNVNNDVQAADDGVDDGSEGLYDANIHFGDDTFDQQKVNVNNINTGINAVQQGGIAVAVDLLDDDGAVAMNVLDQVATNSFGDDMDALVDGNCAEYAGQIFFGERTFQNQKVNVNNINSGINAAQQGAIAVSVSAKTSSGLL